MHITKGGIIHLEALQLLFKDTIQANCTSDYNESQIIAWVSSIKNKNKWNTILSEQVVLIAKNKNTIVGFCTLENNCHVDMLYVHKDFQRQGIASKLLDAIEKIAMKKNQKKITTFASISAYLFFKKRNYNLIKEEKANINSVELTNYFMSKILT